VLDGVGPSRKKALDLLGDLFDASNQLTGKFRGHTRERVCQHPHIDSTCNQAKRNVTLTHRRRPFLLESLSANKNDSMAKDASFSNPSQRVAAATGVIAPLSSK